MLWWRNVMSIINVQGLEARVHSQDDIRFKTKKSRPKHARFGTHTTQRSDAPHSQKQSRNPAANSISPGG
jgi:hypothetical protein